MASTIAVPWQDVLDEMDDRTAFLILKLQLDDVDEHQNITASPSKDHQADDWKLARTFLRNDLEVYRAARWYDKDEPDISDAASAPVLFNCIICQDNFDGDHVWQVPCGHWYCDGCLNQLFRVAMTHEDAYPPRCCRQGVEFEEVRIFLDRKLSAEFALKKEELDDTRRVYCHDPKCSAYIGQDGRKGERATCQKCGLVTCRLCKQSMHTGDCASDESVEQTLRLAETEGWQRCSSCERMVELRTGCNHIT